MRSSATTRSSALAVRKREVAFNPLINFTSAPRAVGVKVGDVSCAKAGAHAPRSAKITMHGREVRKRCNPPSVSVPFALQRSMVSAISHESQNRKDSSAQRPLLQRFSTWSAPQSRLHGTETRQPAQQTARFRPSQHAAPPLEQQGRGVSHSRTVRAQ